MCRTMTASTHTGIVSHGVVNGLINRIRFLHGSRSVIKVYQSEVTDFTENQYLGQLEDNFKKDQILGHTSFGVHRDDYLFRFNDQLANGSASRGETRSIILALKFIEATLGQKPLILLDDVFSELDSTRRQCLVNNFKHHQVILTSVEDIDK